MDKNKEKWIRNVSRDMLKYLCEVTDMEEYTSDMFNRVYREICEEMGIEAALGIHNMFKGTQVSFPVRFLDTKYIKQLVVKEFDGTNVKELAKKYNYSEKSIRRMIKEHRDFKCIQQAQL